LLDLINIELGCT